MIIIEKLKKPLDVSRVRLQCFQALVFWNHDGVFAIEYCDPSIDDMTSVIDKTCTRLSVKAKGKLDLSDAIDWRVFWQMLPRPILCLTRGSDFKLKVLLALIKNPSKEWTYKSLAQKIGSPKAYRAVGNAVASNPFFYVVPCHRVLPASKIDVGNYRWGKELKRKLLQADV